MERKRTSTIVVACALLGAACVHRNAESRTHVETVPTASGTTIEVTLAKHTLPSGGHDRTYLLYAPESPTPLPLVIALHGHGGTGTSEDRLGHWSKIAAREKFVLALPDGHDKGWNDARENDENGWDDVGFLNDLIGELTLHRQIDPARVYVTGMSNGGFMAESFACRSAEKVAAIAIVGALLPVTLESCKPAKTMPVMIVSGDHDPLVPYLGGGVGFRGKRGQIVSADDTVKFWADAAGCTLHEDGALPDTDPDDGTITRTTIWSGCRDGASVEIDRVIGGGHTWPGGLAYLPEWAIGKTSRDWDASERIWAFFKPKTR